MTIRPIIFSTPMVQALLAGRKTQTRRLASSPLRRVEVGDLLYVREAFKPRHSGDPSQGAKYLADVGTDQTTWKPSIHMPRWASRLSLEVTRVRYDRLQAISWEDAEAEGVWHSSAEYREQVCIWRDAPQVLRCLRIENFSKLWDTLHDKPGERWADDPQIVALTFTVHHANVDQVAAGKAVG